MITQLDYQNERWALIASSAPLPYPTDFGFNMWGRCGRRMALRNGELYLDKLALYGTIVIKDQQYRTSGPLSTWNFDEWKGVLADLPSINGARPEPQIYTAAGARLRDGEITNFEDGRVDCIHYDNVGLPVDYYGGIFIGIDGRGFPFPSPHFYKRVLELCFEDNKLQQVIDQRRRVRRIVANADHALMTIWDAMSREGDTTEVFEYVYPNRFRI